MTQKYPSFLKELGASPLLVLCICMIIGIVADEKCGSITIWAMLPFGIAFVVLFLMERGKANMWMERALDIAILGTFIGLGAIVWESNGSKKPIFPEHFIGEKHQMVGIVSSNVKQYDKGRSTQVEVLGYLQDSFLMSFPAKMRLSIDSTLTMKIEKHDTIYFTGYVREVASDNSSYLKYLHHNNIFLSCRTKNLVVAGKRKSFRYQVESIQGCLTEEIFQIMPDSSTAGVAVAMFLGESDFLDIEVNKDFSQAGVSHILAISGQHIAIIFMILNSIFKHLHYVKKGKRYKNVLLLVILLVYMILCGAAASVVRSVIMFCVILSAKLLRRRYKILNLMGLAAMIQLIIAPTIIYNLGFQLSYSAVAGIVIFYPFFERYFRTNSRALNEIFSWIGITLTAQIFTIPFILLAFGQFSTYFLLSNILMALLGYVTIFVGFIMVMLFWMPYINVMLGYLTHVLLKAMMLISHFITTLPYPVIDKLLHPGMMILLLQLIIAPVLLFLPKLSKKEVIESDISGLEKIGLG